MSSITWETRVSNACASLLAVCLLQRRAVVRERDLTLRCVLVRGIQELGFAAFKPHQFEVLVRLVKNTGSVIWRDKTAAGKSLPWMLLPVVDRELGERPRGPILVVLPLKLIAVSHVAAIEKINRALVKLGKQESTVVDCTTATKASSDLKKVDIVLFIPENLTSGAYVKALNNVTRGGAGVRLIVLDEVHLLLEWQYDFRTCLRMIYPLCHHGSCASMLATSATITDVDIDAIKQLYVPAASSALVICESICRSDLRVHLRQYVDDVHIDLALVRRIVSDELGALALVFAGRFATMAEYVDGLRLHPETAALIEQHPERFQRFLHALQSDENQALTMHDVQTGELRLVWCSQAASNGININRRVAVFVLGSLGSLHFIVQGIGRASRDGAGADVYLVANKASFATHIASLTTRLNDVQQTKKVRGDELVVNKVCLAVWRAQHAQLVALSAAFGGAAGAVRCGARLLYESFGGVPGDHYSNNGSCSCVVALSIAAVVGEEATMEAASRPQLSNPDVVRVLEALRVARDAVYEDELHPLGVHALADDALLVEIARDSVQHHRASQPVYAPGRASQAQLEERRVAASACVLLVTLQENRVGTNEYIERIVAHVNDMLLARHRPHRQLALETDDDADDPHD